MHVRDPLTGISKQLQFRNFGSHIHDIDLEYWQTVTGVSMWHMLISFFIPATSQCMVAAWQETKYQYFQGSIEIPHFHTNSTAVLLNSCMVSTSTIISS